jgi:hypothetical protein
MTAVLDRDGGDLGRTYRLGVAASAMRCDARPPLSDKENPCPDPAPTIHCISRPGRGGQHRPGGLERVSTAKLWSPLVAN